MLNKWTTKDKCNHILKATFFEEYLLEDNLFSYNITDIVPFCKVIHITLIKNKFLNLYTYTMGSLMTV